MTRRLAIMKLLEEDYYSLQEIAYNYGVDIKEIQEDFEHIKQSAKAQGKNVESKPAVCKACGFAFKERSKVKKPSKCPRCRHERIEPAKFRIASLL